MSANGTFVLTSGRSGSTLLARLLHAHPEIVVVSDLLEPALPEIYFDSSVRVDGAEFWSVLTRPSVPERIRFWRKQPTDELLHLPDHDDDVSLLMAYTLPFLDSNPWELRRQLEASVCRRPAGPAPEHFTFVLDFLRDRFGGTTWVERTGGSLPHTAAIVAQWPDAKYVTLSRDPVETSLSMRSGSFFRLYLAMANGDRSNWCNDEFADPAKLAALLEWWTVDAERSLATIAPQQLRRLTYERLTADPAVALADVVGFVLGRQPADRDIEWADAQAEHVTPSSSHTATVPQSQLAEIRAACPEASALWARLRSDGF